MENNEEIKINEAEIEENENKTSERKKIDFRFELALFLILGFLLGVVIKSEAVKRVTIGFNDGEIISVRQGYDFDKIKENIAKSYAEQEQATSATEENNAYSQ